MSVFVRTEEGQEAAYSPQSALPRKLKSILKVIDGRTPIDAFEKNLSSFGDVRAILQSLDMAGLIKLVEGAGTATTPSVTAGASDVSTANKSMWAARPAPAAPFAPSARSGEGKFGAWVEPNNSVNEAANSIRMDSWQASELATQTMPAGQQLQSPALQAVVDSMSLFVLTHLPDQSFQILKEIEEITSLELLAVTLGGYEQMVAVVGEPSVQHLNAIKQVLRDNL